MRFGAFLLRRALLAIPVILGVSLITFSISWSANQGDMSRAYVSPKMSAAQVQQIRESHGFDQPFFVQYLAYLRGLAKGDLGLSRTQGDLPMSQVFRDFFPATLELTLVAMAIAILAGVFFGTLSATHKDRPVDHATRFLALAGVSVPIFWLGLILKFAVSTSYPADLFANAGRPVQAVFLFFALLVPVGVGLFVAGALDARRLSWRRMAGHLAVLAAVAGALFLLHWSFLLVALAPGFALAYLLAAGVKASRRPHVPARVAWALVGAAAVAALAIAYSGAGAVVVRDIFGFVPRLPLGGRMSNDILNSADAHPSVTNGPTGLLLVDTALARDWTAFSDVAQHLVLPAITLGYTSLAIIARLMRATMLEVLTLDFVRTARAKGLSERAVIARHARRNALIPVATAVGLTFGGLLGGAVLTETIFQWPGLGRWSTAAIGSGDTNSVMAFTLFVVVIYLVANFLVDILYGVLDPRVRLS